MKWIITISISGHSYPTFQRFHRTLREIVKTVAPLAGIKADDFDYALSSEDDEEGNCPHCLGRMQ